MHTLHPKIDKPMAHILQEMLGKKWFCRINYHDIRKDLYFITLNSSKKIDIIQ